MRKTFLKVLLVFLLATPTFGEGFGRGGGYKYYDFGYIFTDTTIPSSVAKAVNLNDIPVFSKEKIDLSDLKVGISTTSNILGFLQVGNAGIMAVIKNGGIEQVYYVETKKTKIYVPLGFIPIYVAGIETRVYGK